MKIAWAVVVVTVLVVGCGDDEATTQQPPAGDDVPDVEQPVDDTASPTDTSTEDAPDTADIKPGPSGGCFFSGGVLNMAHRGGKKLRPEHTLEAYQHAVDVGADVLELDLWATSDGVIVALHDETVDRTTDGAGHINTLTFEALRKLDAGYAWSADGGQTHPWRGKGLVVPTLEEILAAHPQACFTVEFKQHTPSIVADVMAIFDEAGATARGVFSSFDDSVLVEVRESHPEAVTGMGVADMLLFATMDPDELEDYEPPAWVAQPPHQSTTALIVERAHKFGVIVHPWTVNDAETMKALIDMGVDGIITDDPALLESVLTGQPLDPPPDPQPERVLALNLHCLKTEGTPYDTNAERMQAVADLVESKNVTVLALQEACKTEAESATALLLDALGAGWTEQWAMAHVAWEGTPDEALEGLALLAKGPISDPAVITHAVQGPLTRVSLCGTVGDPAARVCTVHFDFDDEAARWAQAREIAMAALVDADPSANVIVAGDFNAKPGSETHSALLSFGYVDATAELAASRIDHVMIHRGSALGGVDAALVLTDPPVSDHPGVLVGLGPQTAQTLQVTRIDTAVDVGDGHFVALRGQTAPVDWETGWPLRRLDDGSWRALLTEWDGGPVEFKLLRDDEQWQTGDNEVATPGTDTVVTPTF